MSKQQKEKNWVNNYQLILAPQRMMAQQFDRRKNNRNNSKYLLQAFKKLLDFVWDLDEVIYCIW